MDNEINTGNRKRNKVLQIVIPICFALIAGIFIYKYLSNSESGKAENRVTLSPTVNSTTPNRPISDSFLTKQDVYTAQNDEKNLEKIKKEEFNKGSDKFSKINTNVSGEADSKSFQKRVRSEVVQTEVVPHESIKDPFVQKKTEELKPVNANNETKIKKGFNSFVMKKGAQKDNNISEKENLPTDNFTPTNNNDINCTAVVSTKSKITSHGSVIITLLEKLSIPGETILPAGTQIAARASVMEDRVMLEIESANINGKIVKMALKAYDLDGMEGLFVKNAKLQKSTTSSANSTISNVSSIGENLLGVPGQLAGGIIRGLTGGGSSGSVTLPEGYKMILKSKF